MAGPYRDEPIPGRRSGRPGRPFDRARPDGRKRPSWTFISEEELFGGQNRRAGNVPGSEVPERIRDLLEMTRHYELSEEKRTSDFLKQAAFMADYECGEYRMRSIPVHHLHTGYQEMNADELQGYFSWRTRLRRKEAVPVTRDFIRLYTAEQINLIGVSSPQEALDNLLWLKAYVQDRSGLLSDALMKNVIRDFIIAHDLDHDLALAYCIEDPAAEAAALALMQSDIADDYSLYEALRSLAGERIDGSKFLPQVPEDACHVIARAFRALNERQKELKGKGFTQQLPGSAVRVKHTMFAWLPFRSKQPDGYRYEVDPVRSYEYSQGIWYCSCCGSWKDQDVIRTISDIIRECERLLRKTFHYKNALPDRRKDPQTAKLISDIIAQWMKEKEARNRPQVRIDLTKLSGIRTAADITRERLLEGTTELDDLPVPYTDVFEVPAPQEKDAAAASSVFTPEEAQFLKLLLEQGPWEEYLAGKQRMLSVFADEINEKVYEELGDVILEIEDGKPVLVEEYLDDIKTMLI